MLSEEGLCPCRDCGGGQKVGGGPGGIYGRDVSASFAAVPGEGFDGQLEPSGLGEGGQAQDTAGGEMPGTRVLVIDYVSRSGERASGQRAKL
jgi:hypothetical protein